MRAVNAHSLHSPFLFRLYNEVVKTSKSSRIKEIERHRKQLLGNNDVLETIDFKSANHQWRSVGDIARSSLSTPRFSAFLNRLVQFLAVDTCLETGTSLGINACYLSKGCNKVITIEGSSSLAALARRSFTALDAANIVLKNDDLYQALESEIVRNKPDFYFLDADHRSVAVAYCIDLILKHTPATKCIVIHDIYWSKDMMSIWQSLVEDPRFPLSVDLFQAGLLFPNQKMEKQHFTIRF